MQRPWLKLVAALAVVAALVVGLSLRAAESPFAGNWKLMDISSGHEATLVLFQIEDKDGKPQAKVLASPLLGEGVAIENLKVDPKVMQFDVKFRGGLLHVKGYAPPADAKAKDVLGSISFNNRTILTQFTKTDDKELSAEDAQSKTATGEDLGKARRIRDAKEQQTALKEFLEKHGDKPVAYLALGLLLQNEVKEGAKEEALREAAEKYLKLGARFGPDIEKNTAVAISQALNQAEKVSPFAVEFARKTEQSLTKDDAPAYSIKVLKALAAALKKTGKEDEAKQLEPRIAKIDEALDVEFEKTAVPFKPNAFAGRKGDSQRVSVVELFTGAYCPPCVAADIAFDAALETYKPKDAVLLQYHTHIPAPDRLANTDTVSRMKYYEKDIEGVPSAFLNGKVMEAMGGGKNGGETSYDTLKKAVNEALETDATAKLKVSVERKGDKLDISGDVSDLKKPGEKIKLRFVLIQEVVRYPGGNGQRLHHHVVRALPGGADGFELKEAKEQQKVSVDLAELKKSLDEYMTTFNKGARKFLDEESPLDIKQLKVVALIQDDDSKEILQAAQVDVPEGK